MLFTLYLARITLAEPQASPSRVDEEYLPLPKLIEGTICWNSEQSLHSMRTLWDGNEFSGK